MVELPLWLKPMETLAWIVSRDPRMVGLARLDSSPCSSPPDFVLHNGMTLKDTGDPPAGLSLIWLDLCFASDDQETLPTEAALAELLEALRAGRITATALWEAKGERREMAPDEWRDLTLDEQPGPDRALVPHRLIGSHYLPHRGLALLSGGLSARLGLGVGEGRQQQQAGSRDHLEHTLTPSPFEQGALPPGSRWWWRRRGTTGAAAIRPRRSAPYQRCTRQKDARIAPARSDRCRPAG